MTDEVAWELESPECSSCLPVYAVCGAGGGPVGWARPALGGEVQWSGPWLKGMWPLPSREEASLGLGPGRPLLHMVMFVV